MKEQEISELEDKLGRSKAKNEYLTSQVRELINQNSKLEI